MSDNTTAIRLKETKISGFAKLVSKVKIGTRVIIMAIFIICAVAVPIVMLIMESVKYVNTYNEVLDNLESIRYIMDETKQQGNRILGYCVVSKNIETSGETEIIVNMQNKIKGIREKIEKDNTYQKNIEKLDIVENLLNSYINSYKEGLALCNDTFSLAGDTKFYSMVNTADFLAENCNELLSLELERSEELRNQITSNFKRSIVLILVISIVIIAIAVVLSIVITKSITVPVTLLRRKIATVAKGDLSESAINVSTNDEIGEVSEAFNVMKESLKNIIEKVSSVSNEVEKSVDFVTERIEDNSSRSQQLSASMDLIMKRMEDQKVETKTAQENVGEVRNVSKRISGSIDKIMENTERSLQDSKEGNNNIMLYTNQLGEVNAIMNQVSKVVKELDKSTEEMNDIIHSITNISEQTNLLALNASIEAARAGERGRGFAVVAGEIGKLADNSSISAQKVGDIIAEVQSNAKEMTEKMNIGLEYLDKGNKIASDTMKSFDNIQQGVEVVNGNVKEIIKDISELSKFVHIIFKGIDSVHIAADENTSVTMDIVESVHEETQNLEKVSKIMFELSERAKQLESTIMQFKLS